MKTNDRNIYEDEIIKNKVDTLINIVEDFLAVIVSSCYEEDEEYIQYIGFEEGNKRTEVENWQLKFKNFLETNKFQEQIISYLKFEDEHLLMEESYKEVCNIQGLAEDITNAFSIDIRILRDNYKKKIISDVEDKLSQYSKENVDLRNQVEDCSEQIDKLNKKIRFTEDVIEGQKNKISSLTQEKSQINIEATNKVIEDLKKSLESYRDKESKLILEKDRVEEDWRNLMKELEKVKLENEKLKNEIEKQLKEEYKAKIQKNIKKLAENYGQFDFEMSQTVSSIAANNKQIENGKKIGRDILDMSKGLITKIIKLKGLFDLNAEIDNKDIEILQQDLYLLLESLVSFDKSIYKYKNNYELEKFIDTLKKIIELVV